MGDMQLLHRRPQATQDVDRSIKRGPGFLGDFLKEEVRRHR
jgi:hypothetical protein